MLVVGLVRAVFMFGRRMISGRQALGVEFDMRNALYAKLVRLSFGFYDRHQTGQLMSRATVDLQTVRFFLGYGLIFFFQHVLTIVIVTGVMFVVNWKLALAATAVTPLIVVIAYRYSHVAHPVLRDVQQRLADVATVAEENIVGVHVVKSFAQEQAESAKFEDRSERVFEQSVRANRQRAVYVPLLSFLPIIAQAAVLLVGGRMVAAGTLTYGDFFFFNVLTLMLVMPLRMLGMWIGQAQRATASGERIFEIMDEPEEIADAPHAGAAARRSRARQLRAGLVRVRTRQAGARRHRPRGHPRPDDRADRPHRVGKDDARVARAALLRRDRRAGGDRRGRRARRHARLAAQLDRRRGAGSVPLLGDRPREHRLRRHGRSRRGRSSAPHAWHRRTTSSPRCRTATTPSSASAGSRCPAASASGWPSRVPCCSTRAS